MPFGGALAATGSFGLGLRPLRALAGRDLQHPAHLLADPQPRPMQADPDRSRLQIENPRDLAGGQLLHVMKHKNHAQRRGDAQNRLVQQIVPFGVEQIAFRSSGRIRKQQPQFRIVGHQLIERESVLWSMRALAPHPPAAIPRHGVKPDRQRLRLLNPRQVAQRTVKHLLHGVLGVFRMPADLHAERVDRILQQTDGLFNGFGSVASQEVDSLG